MSYVNVLNFDAGNPDCILELASDLMRGKVFETLEDVGKIMKGLAKYPEDGVSKEILKHIESKDVTPSPYLVDGKCPVCGHKTFINNDDYQMQASFCLVCETDNNQFMHWDEMRAMNEGVLIWNNNFSGVSVEDKSVLESIIRDLKEGIKPDKLKPLIPREPWFRDFYINNKVIRPTMSEYNKYRNTMLQIIANCDRPKVVDLAKEILSLLENLSTETDIVDGKEHNLKRLSL